MGKNVGIEHIRLRNGDIIRFGLLFTDNRVNNVPHV